jgi:cytochrome oxidase Cu insertion factor (SCO1/SenC/PrrC family)
VSENAPRNLASLWLIIALCVAPVAASYLAYYFYAPRGHVNYGELIETRPLPPARLRLLDGSEFTFNRLRGKWILLMVNGGACGEACQKKLFAIRQLRLTQGRDMNRIERVWLVDDAEVPAVAAVAGFEGTWLVRGAGSAVLAALPAERKPADYIYVIDPLGNMVLRYAHDADPARIIKDLTRLLKTSGIG